MASRPGATGSFWPSRQQELLLATVLLADEPARAAWESVRPTLDVQRLERGSAALLGMLYERLTAWDGSEESEIVPRLKGVYRYIWYGNQVGLQTLKASLGTLSGAAVETVVLGDAALILRYYVTRGVRPLADPSVLVAPDRLDVAVGALERDGWEPAGARAGRSQKFRRRADGRRIALAWRLPLGFEPLAGASVAQRLGVRTEPIDVLGASSAALAPADELLAVCIGGARSGSSSRVQWVADAFTILATRGQDLDWERVVDEAGRMGAVLRVRAALGYLEERFDAGVPEAVLASLSSIETPFRQRLAQRIGGRGGAVLGNVPAIVAAHVVETSGSSVLRTALTAPRAVRAEWGVQRAREVPGAALRRTRASLAERLETRRHRRLAS